MERTLEEADKLIATLTAIITEELMPSVVRIAVQDFGRLNTALIESRQWAQCIQPQQAKSGSNCPIHGPYMSAVCPACVEHDTVPNRLASGADNA